MGLTPIPMMDRARKHELPQSQVGVASGVGTVGYPRSRNFRGWGIYNFEAHKRFSSAMNSALKSVKSQGRSFLDAFELGLRSWPSVSENYLIAVSVTKEFALDGQLNVFSLAKTHGKARELFTNPDRLHS